MSTAALLATSGLQAQDPAPAPAAEEEVAPSPSPLELAATASRAALEQAGLERVELAGNVGDVVALLDHLGLERAHVLGTSFGGEVIVPDSVISTYLVTEFPWYVGVIVFLGLISAGMSTLEGLIQSLSVIITEDLVHNVHDAVTGRGLSERFLFALNRVVIVALLVQYGLYYTGQHYFPYYVGCRSRTRGSRPLSGSSPRPSSAGRSTWRGDSGAQRTPERRPSCCGIANGRRSGSNTVYQRSI